MVLGRLSQSARQVRGVEGPVNACRVEPVFGGLVVLEGNGRGDCLFVQCVVLEE